MTLNETPAMASGLEDHIWTIRELIEESEDTQRLTTQSTSPGDTLGLLLFSATENLNEKVRHTMADATAPIGDCVYWVAIQGGSLQPEIFGPFSLTDANSRRNELVFSNSKAKISSVFVAHSYGEAEARAATYLTSK